MKCANPACINEFERVGKGSWNKRFCSPSCEKAVNRHSQPHKDSVARHDAKWNEKNPEAIKEKARKHAKKHYLSGKLPPWMFR